MVKLIRTNYILWRNKMTNETNNPIEKDDCNCGHNHADDHDCCKNDDTQSCNCGHDHDHDHDHVHEHQHMVTFENEDGSTEEVPVVDEFDLDGQTYVLVMNTDETVTPLRVDGEEGDLVFLTEEEFHKVSEAYAALVEAEDFEEEE